MDMAEFYEYTEQWLLQRLVEKPDLTGAEVLEDIRTFRRAIEGMTDTAQCRHCHRPISRTGDNPWRHTDPDRCRGCRAATFTPDEGWDDSLDRSLKADPPKHWRR